MSLRRYKKKLDYTYTFGVFPTIELLETRPQEVIAILVSSKATGEGIKHIRDLCKRNDIKLNIADKTIAKLAIKDKTQIIGAFRKYKSPLDLTQTHIVLAQPSLPGNVGTIVRTAVGFGVKNLALIRPAIDIFDPMTVRASMGAVFQMNFAYFNSFNEYTAEYANHSIYPFVLGGKTELRKVHFASPVSLVFGNEGSGLSQEFEKYDNTVRISHSTDIESLNLSTAVALALWELSC